MTSKRVNIPAFIPDEKQISSMEAFRAAVLTHKPFKDYFLDNLNDINGYDDNEWHLAFTQYHELHLDYDYIAITLALLEGIVDDLQFVPIEAHTAINMGLSIKLK